ncbi:MAG: L-aspartate oxidase [Candidatus Eisenbacteria bacterium]|nr:L-aspartate oxidase [Candidatus Eisenbacteria bacterium]
MASDFLVVGSGMAGLLFAMEASRHGSVTILTKRSGAESNTVWAQGGIAAVMGDDDALSLHAQDTLAVGGGLARPEVVEIVVGSGPALIRRLESLGIVFSRDAGGARLALGREGGHGRRRVVHSGDSTGRRIQETLLARARENPRIRILENHFAVDIIRSAKIRPGSEDAAVGVYALDGKTREVLPFAARIVVLATGGCGKVYRYTSNPDLATGDGIAMAYRAGCRVANLEFMQFHPTCLYHPEAKNFLISEAVRGEGATLTSVTGERFMSSHPMQELAPRDVVARAIDREMKERGKHHVLLHLEHLDGDRLRARFPGIYETCLRFGIDFTRQPLPVVPAAHYICGGVVVDPWGASDLPGLFAAGEVAHTGLHGANRLASNSLLEAGVFALRAAEEAGRRLPGIRPVGDLPAWEIGAASLPKESVLVDAHWDLVRRLMWDFVGIVRTDHRLELARRYIELVRGSIESYYWDFVLDPDLVELRNVALVAELMVQSAVRRSESRGLHYNLDHQEAREDPPRDTVLRTPGPEA